MVAHVWMVLAHIIVSAPAATLAATARVRLTSAPGHRAKMAALAMMGLECTVVTVHLDSR